MGEASSLGEQRRVGLAGRTGEAAIESVREIARLGAVCAAAAIQMLRVRKAWPRTVREALIRQILQCGVGSVRLLVSVGFLVGMLIVGQYQMWAGRVIESRYLAQVVVAVIFRELAPLLVNILLVARSGSAMVTELGLMTSLGEVRALDAQGLDPMAYLVTPRVLGLTVSTVFLTAYFLLAALAGVYVSGQWVGAKTGPPLDWCAQVLQDLSPRDVATLAVKSTVGPWVAASICCVEGLRASHDVVAVPSQTGRAMQRSLIAVVLVMAALSYLAYLF